LRTDHWIPPSLTAVAKAVANWSSTSGHDGVVVGGFCPGTAGEPAARRKEAGSTPRRGSGSRSPRGPPTRPARRHLARSRPAEGVPSRRLLVQFRDHVPRVAGEMPRPLCERTPSRGAGLPSSTVSGASWATSGERHIAGSSKTVAPTVPSDRDQQPVKRIRPGASPDRSPCACSSFAFGDDCMDVSLPGLWPGVRPPRGESNLSPPARSLSLPSILRTSS